MTATLPHTDTPHDRAPSADLRRRRVREVAEAIVDAAAWCTPEDRAILIAIYRENLSASEVASMRNQQPRALRRRLKRLVKRTLSPRFEFVVLHRASWPHPMRRVATAHVLQGRTLRDTASHLNLSLHIVRRQADRINALFEAAQGACA